MQHVMDVTRDPSLLSETGVAGPLFLNDLEYFHVTQNYTLDIMHDLLEGVCPYELKLVLKVLIRDKKYISLDILNERIRSFNYGYSESGSKPRDFAKLYP